MKNPEELKISNIENLYSFYKEMGKNSGFLTGKAASATYISGDSMAWPSFILGGGKMARSSLVEIFRQMKEGSLPFFWIRPINDDPEFEDFAEEYGIRKINFWKGMNLIREEPFGFIPPVAGAVFEEVITSSDLKEWLSVVNSEIISHRELALNRFTGVLNHPSFRFFRVKIGKRTISTILIHKRPTETGIYMVATLLEQRGKGFGRWITASAIDTCIAGGQNKIVLHSTPLGYPVYRKLGFVECCEYGIFWMLGKK